MVERAQLIKYGQHAGITLAALIIGPYALKASIEFLPGLMMLAGAGFAGYKIAWPAMKKAADFATQTASSLWSRITSGCSRAKNKVANVFARGAAANDLRTDNARLGRENLQGDDAVNDVLEGGSPTVTPAASGIGRNDVGGDKTPPVSPSSHRKNPTNKN